MTDILQQLKIQDESLNRLEERARKLEQRIFESKQRRISIAESLKQHKAEVERLGDRIIRQEEELWRMKGFPDWRIKTSENIYFNKCFREKRRQTGLAIREETLKQDKEEVGRLKGRIKTLENDLWWGKLFPYGVNCRTCFDEDCKKKRRTGLKMLTEEEEGFWLEWQERKLEEQRVNLFGVLLEDDTSDSDPPENKNKNKNKKKRKLEETSVFEEENQRKFRVLPMPPELKALIDIYLEKNWSFVTSSKSTRLQFICEYYDEIRSELASHGAFPISPTKIFETSNSSTTHRYSVDDIARAITSRRISQARQVLSAIFKATFNSSPIDYLAAGKKKFVTTFLIEPASYIAPTRAMMEKIRTPETLLYIVI